MQIGGVQKTSLLDFPDKISAIVFTLGCNFRCGYCHNPELINSKEQVWTLPALFDFLNARKGKLDGVVITGGEPCLQNDLEDVIKEIKALGFLVKLDTNGYFPQKLKKLLPHLDYIAMDIKAPLEKYSKITCVKFEDFSKIGQLIKGAKRYYLQKFIPSKLLDETFMNETTYTNEDFKKIIEILNQYVPNVTLRN